jgi:hypothetical protein
MFYLNNYIYKQLLTIAKIARVNFVYPKEKNLSANIIIETKMVYLAYKATY